MITTKPTSAPWHFQLLRWLALLAAVAIFIYGLVTAAGVIAVMGAELVALGWGINPVFAFFACQGNRECQQVSVEVFMGRFPLIYFGVALFGAALMAVIFTTLANAPALPKLPGSARWAERRDLQLLLKGQRDNPLRGYLGCLPKGGTLRVPERLRCAHTLVVGGTGAGKSTAYFKPNLVADALDRCSAVVIDLKYPDTQSGLFDVVPVFKEMGHDVQLFLPFNEETLRWPILKGGENSSTAAAIADILCPRQEREGDGGFFSKQQRGLLQGLILAITRENLDPFLDPRRLIKALSEGADALSAYANNHPDPEVRQRLRGIFEQERRIRTGIVQGLREELELFNDKSLAWALSKSMSRTGMVDLVGLGTKPTLLYIGIPQEKLLQTRGQALLQLLKRSLDAALLETSTKLGGKLPVHTSIYLDEFAALGRLPNVGDNFATMRSRNVAYHISLQNRAQGEALYGRTEFHAFIDGNFRQTLLFPRYLSHNDAEFFARSLGQTTVIEHTSGTSRQGFFGQPRQDKRQREMGQWLVTPDEMREWPEGRGLLIQGGLRPAQVLLPRLDQKHNPYHRAYYKIARKGLDVATYSHETVNKRAWPPGFDETKPQAQADPITAATDPTRTVATPAEVVAKPAEAVAKPTEAIKAVAKPTEVAKPAAVREAAEETATTKEAKTQKLGAWWRGRGNSSEQALSTWLGRLLELEVPVKTEPHPHKKHEVARVVVSVASLIEVPTELPSWLQQGWVARSASEIAITPSGVKILDQGLLKRARLLCEERERQQREAEAMVKVREKLAPLRKDQTVPILRAWIAKNGQDLEGHPDYEKLSDEEKKQIGLLGRYTLEAVQLPVVAVRTVLGEVPEGFSSKRFFTQEGLYIPVTMLMEHPELLQWCKDNVHRIKGHQRYQEQEKSLGEYEPETIALPKGEYERILGYVPEGGEERRLYIGVGEQRRRRTLIELKLNGEVLL